MPNNSNGKRGSLESFRKLLESRIKNAQASNDLLNKEQKSRLNSLLKIFEKLKRGENVQNRQLKRWLSKDEFSQFEAEWQEQLELRSELKDKPNELKQYEEKLKQATFNHNRAESYSCKGKHATAKKFYNKSESLCEEAFEMLQEILHSDSSLRIWFDREISFEVGGDVSADIASLPRLVTSRSYEKLATDCRLATKRHVKLRVVEQAIETIGRDKTLTTKSVQSKLDELLNSEI